MSLRTTLGLEPPLTVAKAPAGRSLWGDAWMRLRRNRAAMVSGVFIIVMALVCIIGPFVTQQTYSQVFQDYGKEPPSLTPYPWATSHIRALEGAAGAAIVRYDLVPVIPETGQRLAAGDVLGHVIVAFATDAPLAADKATALAALPAFANVVVGDFDAGTKTQSVTADVMLDDSFSTALGRALRSARVNMLDVVIDPAAEHVEVRMASASDTRPVDPRIAEYLDRSDLFESGTVVTMAADSLSATVRADIVSQTFVFGTDTNGRSLLPRTLIGGRISLVIGVLAALVALIVGVTYGSIAGYFGGRVDLLMMRVVDILYSLPFIFFVILLLVFFGRSFVLIFLAIGAIQWLDMARIVRGQTLSIKRREYIEAAHAMGTRSSGILRRHIIPNLLGPVVIYATLLVPQAILQESFLSFLGLGVQDPLTSWGLLISEGQKNIQGAWWLLIFPTIFLVTTLFALNFLGDGLRDALDPAGPLTMAEYAPPPGAETILEIKDLHVRFAAADGEVHAVRGASIRVARGETVAIVGESGSGKSQTVMAAMGLLAKNGKATGSVTFRGRELLGLPPKALNDIRGDRLTMIFQEPMTSLDPLYTVGRQIMEPIRHHRNVSKDVAQERALELLRLVGVQNPERRLRSYPHEMSGGQRQRVMIAMALANGPDALIADEPTTALDVTIQAQILDLIARLRRELGMAVVFITHDLGLVRRLADRVYVMRQGEVVEEGPIEAIFGRPQHPYTRMLIAAEPTGTKIPARPDAPVLIEAEDLRVTFNVKRGFLSKSRLIVKAVDGVSFTLHEGQTIGVVGESGSGKSTLGRAILRLLPSEGRLVYRGRDLRGIGQDEMRPLRRELQIVFQDPFGSLSPRLTVGQIVTEGLLVHEPGLTRAARDRRAIAALEEVQLDPATRNRYPHEFSGGQRQRIAIARALILKPKIMVLDEPTSALDRSVQKQIVDLLRRLQQEHTLTYLFISHDLAVVRAMSDWILVMKDGRVVEAGPSEEIFGSPREPYTRELMTAALANTRFGREPIFAAV